MSRGYRAFAERHRRLVVLRVTAEGNGTANDRLLADALEHWGLTGTLDQVRTTVKWLADNGFLTLEELPGDVLKVKITRSGREVATGRASHPDIAVRNQAD